MFAYRVRTATTRANASFQSHFYNRDQCRTIYISSPRHRQPTNALVDQSRQKPPGSVAEIKEQQRLANKHGKRGSQKMSQDDFPLPVMDITLPDLRLLERRLSSKQLPGSRKRRPIIARFGLMAANIRNASREWEENVPTNELARKLSPIAFSVRYMFERGTSVLSRVLNSYRLSDLKASLGATKTFINQKWRNHQNREYEWRTFLKWRRRFVQKLIDWLEESPELKKLKQNDKMNYAAMRLLAEKNKFPGYNFRGGLVDRTSPRLRFKYAKEIEEEDIILYDLSSENPALKDTLDAAATRYIEMNRAVASGDTARLTQFADRRYLKELERRASTIGRTHRGAVTEWQFHRFTKPPTCLSIRAHDFLSEFRKSLVIGDRLYVNMLVKFESIQSLKVTRKEGDKYAVLKDIAKQKVVEYLILDVRTWVPDRYPKFVMEVYEGQPLELNQSGLTPQGETEDETKTKEEADDGLSHPAAA